MSLLEDPSLLWYVNRAAGLVLLILLTLATTLGVSAVDRRTRPRAGPATARRSGPRGRLPGFVLPELHRRIALVAAALSVVHVVPAVLDDYVPIDWIDVVIPFASEYRPAWLGMAALSFDVLGVVIVTALLRIHLGPASWKAVHKAVYVAWPMAMIHAVGTGSDLDNAGALIVGLCGLTVIAALAARLRSMHASDQAERLQRTTP